MSCQKCNREQSKIPNEFSKMYMCEMCDNTCCINCMYLYCSTCNKDFACFWCSANFRRDNNISFGEDKKLKCKTCKTSIYN